MIRSSNGKARKRRLDSKILHMVRLHDAARDGYCRVRQDGVRFGLPLDGSATELPPACDGPSELAHLEDKRRFKTRGQKPELRHTTGGTVMLCQKHHALYDARKLRVTLLSNAGADGELRWSFR